MIDYGLETILSTCTSLSTVPYFCKLHIEIIYEYEYICRWIDLIKVDYSRDWFTREVHICSRLEEEDLLTMKYSLTHESHISRIRPIWEPKGITKHIDHQISSIVSSILILGPRITKSDDDFHRDKIDSLRLYLKNKKSETKIHSLSHIDRDEENEIL